MGTGQAERVVATFIGDAELQAAQQFIFGLIALITGYTEHATARIVGLERAYLFPVAHETSFNVQCAPLSSACLERHTSGHATYHVSTLRIEIYLQLVTLVVE